MNRLTVVHFPIGLGAQRGYYRDAETGFQLCTYRYYDPVEGRWLTQDPIGLSGGLNLYGYVGGNPVGWSDPSRQIPLVLIVIAVVAVLSTEVAETPMRPGDFHDPSSFGCAKLELAAEAAALFSSPEILGGAVRSTWGLLRARKIRRAANEIGDWLGTGATRKPSKSSDLVLVSKDNQRVIHFDLTRTYPHKSPHVDVRYPGGTWKIWPKDVPKE